MESSWRFIVYEGAMEYYCVICGHDLKGFADADDHARGALHAMALEEHGQEITHDHSHRYLCHVCECIIVGYTNVRCHLKGQRHQENLYGSDYEEECEEEFEEEDYWEEEYDEDDNECCESY